MNAYSGIGSRQTPADILLFMTDIALFLCAKDYILRSGGAGGADTAFENGVDDLEKKEIYLPWKDFNNNRSPLYRVTDEALGLASKYHPVWNKLSFGARKLMGRNCYQVLGFNLKAPSEFLICWTKKGKEIGGTALAVKLAKDNGVPVYNLFFDDVKNKIQSWIDSGTIVHG